MTVTDLPRRAAAEVIPDPAPRWIPSRAGILNVWRYYDEVFEFHEGRLLLRGPNGSGKSKALELLLPFLFDANLRANRLSTFGTGERTMHWNLMGEARPAPPGWATSGWSSGVRTGRSVAAQGFR